MTAVDDQLIQCVVLLKRQSLLTEHLVKKGQAVMQEFQDAIAGQKQSVEHVLDVLNFAFALIDSLVKYQKIARSVPRLSQKSPEYRSLISSLGELTEIRNQHQHINRYLLNNFTGPLIGTVSWVVDAVNYSASFNDIGRERSVPGMVFDIKENRFVLEFCYIFGDKYHDLQKAITGMRDFHTYIDSTMIVAVDGIVFNGNEHYLATSAKLTLKQSI